MPVGVGNNGSQDLLEMRIAVFNHDAGNRLTVHVSDDASEVTSFLRPELYRLISLCSDSKGERTQKEETSEGFNLTLHVDSAPPIGPGKYRSAGMERIAKANDHFNETRDIMKANGGMSAAAPAVRSSNRGAAYQPPIPSNPPKERRR